MPLTRKDRVYISKLHRKNALVLPEADDKEMEKRLHQGLEKAMSPSERKRR